METTLKLIAILSVVLSVVYINSKVATGEDMQLILVKLITIILGSLTVSVLITKIIMPNEVDKDNTMTIFALIERITLLIVGYIFGTKKSKLNNK